MKRMIFVALTTALLAGCEAKFAEDANTPNSQSMPNSNTQSSDIPSTISLDEIVSTIEESTNCRSVELTSSGPNSWTGTGLDSRGRKIDLRASVAGDELSYSWTDQQGTLGEGTARLSRRPNQ